VFEQVPILVVDDNADFLQLLQRYVSSTRFAVAGLQEPQQALAVAKELVPEIIILDVMMPTVDGWEVLNLLHHCPITCHTPIVICSILPQAPLALALGAHTFLPKPVTQHEFLALLDRLTEA
jgi:CheY-like chemotaxis protein